MKIGYTVWTWLMDEHNDFKPFSPYGKRDFEQSLKEISDLGYTVFENFNILVDIFEDSPDEFSALTQKYGLELVNIYHYLTDDFDADMAFAERCCKFVRAHGATMLNIEAPNLTESAATQAELEVVTEKLIKMGELARDHGVSLLIHPHCERTVYLEHEIDYVLEHVDASLLNLCMDTAHAQLAGMDPLKAFAKYMDRIKYVHLKDLNPAYPPDDPMRGFVALGEGIVDFRGVLKVLQDHGYDGCLVVEQDWQRVCNYETAMVSRSFIRRVLGM